VLPLVRYRHLTRYALGARGVHLDFPSF
jgi:hypothetical protein